MAYSMVRLGDICSITKGKTGIMKAIPGEYPMVGLGEVDKTNIDYQFDAKAVIIPLVSSTGHGSATMKRVKYIEGKFALGTILCAVIPKDDSIVSAKYLQIYLHENRDDLLVSLMKGAANVTLPIKKLYDIEIPLPPIEEQMRIVGLDGNVALINNRLSEEITQQKEYLKRLKQSILQDAISGKLTQEWRANNLNIEPATQLLKQIKTTKQQQIKEGKLRKEKPLDLIDESTLPFTIPPTWTWCRLGEVFHTASGGTPSRSNKQYWGGDIVWYKSGELNDGVLSRSSLEKITIDGLKSSSTSLFPKGTLLIAMYGATAGKLAILDIDATTNQAVCGIYENKHIFTKYIFYYLLSQRQKMIDDSWGMSQPNISQTYLKSFLIPIAPYEEQLKIVKVIESLLNLTKDLESQITNSKLLARQLTKSILTETFTND